MKNFNYLALLAAFVYTPLLAQEQSQTQAQPFNKMEFLIGQWTGTGTGFGNDRSVVSSEFSYIMNGRYIQVRNESKFEPTQANPEGEHHIDLGIISYDKSRNRIVFRQFHIEGYITQYVLVDSLSGENRLVFETETIENFVPGGKARWTIEKSGTQQIRTIFDVSFPGREYACFGTNELYLKE